MTACEFRPKQITEKILESKKNRGFAIYLCYDEDNQVYVASREIPEALHQFRTKSLEEARCKYKEYYLSIKRDLERVPYYASKR